MKSSKSFGSPSSSFTAEPEEEEVGEIVKPTRLSTLDHEEEINPWGMSTKNPTKKQDHFHFVPTPKPPSQFEVIGKRSSSLPVCEVQLSQNSGNEFSQGCLVEDTIPGINTPIPQHTNAAHTESDKELVKKVLYNQETLVALIQKVERAKAAHAKQLIDNGVLVTYIRNAQDATNNPKLK